MIKHVVWQPAQTSDLPGVHATMRHIAVKAGHKAERHHHDHEQFLFVAHGHGKLEHEGGSIMLEPGTALHLPPGSWHSAEFTADTVLIETNLS